MICPVFFLCFFIVANKCSCMLLCLKVTVRCACQNLKKEWRCQDVQNAYHTNGNNLKDVSKNRFGLGILPCNSECMVKLKARDSELLLRKTNVVEVPDILNEFSLSIKLFLSVWYHFSLY